ncbi:hypothetical protein [Acinetobacter sp. P1(2025)]|uniref:hypothetical protein n=1 Tax=Acinetobacter sp. P1(2025) TaxID=3446120 RepID=UPI003F535137
MITYDKNCVIAQTIATIFGSTAEYVSLWLTRYQPSKEVIDQFLEANAENAENYKRFYYLGFYLERNLNPLPELLKHNTNYYYWLVEDSIIKSLSEDAFNYLLDHSRRNPTMMRDEFYALLVLRYSTRKTELRYVALMNMLSSEKIIQTQESNGKLYGFAQPYLDRHLKQAA